MALWRRILRATPGELTVQDAIYEVLRRSDARLNEISNRTGIPYETLRSYSCESDNPAGNYRAMPAHQVPPITNATKNYALLDALEASCGRVAILMPTVTEPTRDVLLEVAGAAMEFGELTKETAKALVEGGISRTELETIEDDGYQMIQHVLRVMAAARAALESGPAPKAPAVPEKG